MPFLSKVGGKRDRLVVVFVARAIDERHGAALGRGDDRRPKRASAGELCAVSLLELGPLCRIVREPASERVARTELGEPRFDIDPILRDTARPQAVDKKPLSVLGTRGFVDALRSDRHPSSIEDRIALTMTEFQGARVLITGAASGIGRRMALGVARRGGMLALWDLNGEGLESVKSEVEALGGKATATVCDVSERAAVYAAAAAEGPVDVLINNAGVVSGQALLEISDEQIEKSFDVNALSLFWMTRAFLPGMIERGRGHVVTISSAGGLLGVPGLTDYCATKWAAIGFDESLRVELEKKASGVRTTVICPYYTDTGMFEGVKTRFSFLLPILNEEHVAEKVIRAVERNRARLWMPPFLYSIPLLRLLPVPWFDTIAKLMGISVSMDEFKGRTSK